MRQALDIDGRAVDGVDVPPLTPAWIVVQPVFFTHDWTAGKGGCKPLTDDLLGLDIGLCDDAAILLVAARSTALKGQGGLSGGLQDG